MKPDEILQYCLKQLPGTVLVESWGERGIFYNPDGKLKRGVYVLTIKEYDGENDSSSNLDRENIFRVNIGIRKDTFRRLFGEIPQRPPKGGVVDMAYDFTQINEIMPHPVYAWMGWICVLNPTVKTFSDWQTLLMESYEFAKEKYDKKAR